MTNSRKERRFMVLRLSDVYRFVADFKFKVRFGRMANPAGQDQFLKTNPQSLCGFEIVVFQSVFNADFTSSLDQLLFVSDIVEISGNGERSSFIICVSGNCTCE